MKKLQRSSGGSCVSMKAGNQARFIHTLTCAAFAPLLLLAPSMVHAKVIHVNGSLNADPVADGLTWQTAFTTVREGVDATAEGDELWVAAALYLETIALKSGVALYGGFVGTETNWALRDLTTQPPEEEAESTEIGP